MTEAMLCEEKRQGVVIVIATPHFYADRMSVDGFLERRADALEKTGEIRRQSDTALPEIIAGAEVYYFQGMGQADAIPRLCIGETNTLLLEMPFEQWTETVLKDVRDLINKQHLRIVLAHIERYIGFQKNMDIWNRVMDLPIHKQINAGSFARKDGFFMKDRKKKFCMDFLRKNPDLIIGSDCHNTDSRRPNLEAGRAAIAAALGEGALAKIDAETRAVLDL